MACLAHRVIRMLPPRWQSSIEQESRDWVMRCPCGYETSAWDMGGIRYKALGNPMRSGRCAKCGNTFTGQMYQRSKRAASAEQDSRSPVDSSTVLPIRAEGQASPAVRPAVDSMNASCLLWIDGAGCFRIIGSSSLSIGSHCSDGTGADLQLLAPLAKRQAVIARGGEGYSLRLMQGSGEERLLRSGESFDIGEGVRLRLAVPNLLSQSAVLDFVGPHRPARRCDGLILMDRACILGPAEDAHIRCPTWSRAVVLFRREGRLWCQAAPGLQTNGTPFSEDQPLQDGTVLTGDDLRLRVELSCD